MKKDEIIQRLKKECISQLEQHKKANDKNKIKIYTSINNIINTPNAFDKLDATVAYNIINDLVHDQKKAQTIYVKLITKN